MSDAIATLPKGEIQAAFNEFLEGEIPAEKLLTCTLGNLPSEYCYFVIVQLDNPESSFSVKKGPYIVFWADTEGVFQAWTSTDSTFERHSYRCREEFFANKAFFRKSYISNCLDLGKVKLHIVNAPYEFAKSITKILHLGDGLETTRTTDAEIPHSEIVSCIDNAHAIMTFTYGETTFEQKESEMTATTSSTKINSIVTRVKAAGMGAAEFQAGKALNLAAAKAIKPHLPMFVRGYADHTAAPAVMAILVALATEFLPDGEAKNKAAKAADLMMNAAIMEGADKLLNVEALIDNVMKKLPEEARELLG